MVVDGELLLGEPVVERERTEGRIGREVRRLLEAERAAEERAVVGHGHREDGRHAGHVAVHAIGGHGDPVGLREDAQDLLDLLAGVGVVELEHRARVRRRVGAGQWDRLAVVPGLVGEASRRRHVRVDPARGLRPRMRVAVDRGERHGREHVAGEDGAGHEAPHAAATRRRAAEEPCQEEPRQDRKRRIRGVEIADRLDERQAVVQRDEDRVDGERREVAALPPAQLEERPHERGERGQAEERRGAPENEVLDREEHGAPGPLERRRKSGHARRDGRELLEVPDVPRIDPPAEERVGQRQPDRDERGGERDGARDDRAAQRARGGAAGGAPLGVEAQEEGHADRREERETGDLAGDGEPDRQARPRVAPRPRSSAREAHAAEERQGREGREERVHRPEVRKLDRQRAEREEARGGEGRLASREPPAEAIHQPDGQEVEERRERAPDHVRAVVAVAVERGRDRFRQEDRERAVDERVVAAVVGIERRMSGVEVLADALREGELLLDHRDEALVRVEVAALVPVELLEPEERARQQDETEDRAGDRSRGRHVGCSLGPGRAYAVTGMPLRARNEAISERLPAIHASRRSTPWSGETRGFQPSSRSARAMSQ